MPNWGGARARPFFVAAILFSRHSSSRAPGGGVPALKFTSAQRLVLPWLAPDVQRQAVGQVFQSVLAAYALWSRDDTTRNPIDSPSRGAGRLVG